MAQRVGRYTLVRRIGQGGMAEVWMGRGASMGGATKSVAIKFMSARVAGEERYRRMFLAEARLSMLMNHSNVVQVFDAGEERGRPYMVMEWIDGLDLAHLCELRRIAKQPWPPRLVGYVIGEVLRGLAYAHHLIHEGRTQCVVHRDVSPHNVLVSTSGEVKLADFGVARLATEDTSGMHIKGKLRYMAPEHLAGHSREPTVDLYGVGAILHELLSGTRFREDADEVDLYGHILGGRVPRLEVPGIPAELRSLRDGLLQAEVRQRIPSAPRALEYLAAWAGYRNCAVELAQLCRGYMGVTGPRSGVELSAGIDGDADTMTQGAPTRTMDPERRRPSLTTAEVVSVRAGGTPAPSNGLRRRAWLQAAAGVGLAALGAVGVTMWRRLRPDGAGPPTGERDAERSWSAGLASSSGSPGPSGSSPRGGEEGPGRGPGERESGSSRGPSSRLAEGPREGPTLPDDDGSTGMSTGSVASSGAWPGAEPRPADSKVHRRAPATVWFGLAHPVRVAWVRLGRRGTEFVVDPFVQREVPAGRYTLQWRKTADSAWIEGGSFRFASGVAYRIRLTNTGPRPD